MICTLCPRNCGAERAPEHGTGVCRMGTLPKIARAALHRWEEPCISGTRGSGAVFFSGCNLRCVFCQNRTISRGEHGKEITVAQLRDIFLRLRDEGVHNINLVTPSHYTRQIAEALSGLELGIPVVWNSSGYECVETLRMLDGLVQVYLPDLKYALPGPAARYSAAADYPQVARAAILEMYRQTGPFRLDDDGMLQRGVLIRHLILPQQGENTRRVIDWVGETFAPGQVLFSLMSQYVPMGKAKTMPPYDRRITEDEYDAALSYLELLGIENGFTQDFSAATEEYIPDFSFEGL